MSWYRDVYLKSEEWKTLRLLKLVKAEFKCNLCKSTSFSHDAHHLVYKNLHDIDPRDLMILCRKCHEWVHRLLTKYPKLKKLPRNKIKITILQHWRRPIRLAKKAGLKGSKRDWNQPASIRTHPLTVKFGELRKALKNKGLICKERMRLRPGLLENISLEDLVNEEVLLSRYIELTGIDPRRLIPDVRRIFPKGAV